MPTNTYTGNAPRVAQIDTFTPTAVDSETYTLTCNGKTVNFTAGVSTTVALIVAGLLEALQASTDYEWQDVTGSDETTYLKLTATDPGVPFTITSSATGAATLVRAADTASSGPEHWGIATNWSQGNIPQGTLTAPVQAAETVTSGGSLVDTTTYYWVITATNANGETVVSNEQSRTVAAPNQTAVLSWAQVSGATGYKIYRSTAAGTYGATSLVTTIASGSTLTYNDTGAALSAGTPPGVSTAVGDDIVIAYTDKNLRYDLDQSTITPVSFTHHASAPGHIGLPRQNARNYPEYRQRYLEFAGCASVTLGKGDGPSSPLIRLHVGGGTATTALVNRMAQTAEVNQHAACLVLEHASSALTLYNADLGIAVESGQATTLASFRAGYEVGPLSDARAEFGAGCVLSGCTMSLNGGEVDVYSNLSAVNMRNGLLRTFGTATLGTLNGYGGEFRPYSTGLVTTVVAYDGFVVDNGQDPRARTYTNVTLHKGSTWLDPFHVATATNGYILPDGNVAVTADWGKNITVDVS